MSAGKSIYKDDILRLRAEGKTYRDIVKILGCNYSTVTYYVCNQKEKMLIKNRKYQKTRHPFIRKLTFFNNRIANNDKSRDKLQRKLNRIFSDKLQTFCLKVKYGEKIMEENKGKITLQELTEKIGDNPVCYLTGEPIDIYQPRTYNFDHIIPMAKGGKNTLDNLGICTRDANQSKSDMNLDEFYSMCEKVLAYRDKKSQPPTDIDG